MASHRLTDEHRRLGSIALAESNKRRAALRKLYRTLGVDPDILAKTPPIGPRIRHVSKALIEQDPTLPPEALSLEPIYYLRLSFDPDAAALVRLYDRIREDIRPFVPIEALAIAANIPLSHILGLVISTICQTAQETETILTALSHTKVVTETVQSALIRGPDGHRDRADMHKAVGWLPTPRGSVTNISVNANARAAAPTAAAVSLESPEATIRRLAEKFNAERTLTLPPAADAVPADAAAAAVEVPADTADADADADDTAEYEDDV